MAKRALVIIDFQNDYFEGGLFPLVRTERAAAEAAKLLAAARRLGWTVIHVQHVSTEPDPGFFIPGHPGVEIHPSVAPEAGEAVVVKHQINAFLGTDLETRLRSAGVSEIVFAGAMSHMCIDAGVRAASDLGFAAIVASDAIATRDLDFDGRVVAAADVHASFMAALAFAYADVRSTASILAG